MLRDDPSEGNPRAMPCPSCGCAGNYVDHGSYRRTVVCLRHEFTIEVRRVRCKSCKVTHATVPPGVVPYKARSEAFAIAVHASWARGVSNADVRRRFCISESTRRRIMADTRRRACALLACGASRAAVDAALASGGLLRLPALSAAELGARFTENVRLINPRRLDGWPRGPDT